MPKPLLPVAGMPIAGYTLARLARAGVEAAALNLHHLGDQIRHHFGEAFAGMPLTYSEEPELLGTLGALHPLRDFLSQAELVVVINGDSLCRWPLKQLIRRHRASGAVATLMLAREPDADTYGGGVAIDKKGRILGFRGAGAERGEVAHRLVFAGAQILSPRLLRHVDVGPGDTVGDLLMPLLEKDAHFHAVPSRRRWHDLGTPQRYLTGALDWCRGTGPERLWRRSWVSSEAAVDRSSRLRRASVEVGARVEGGAVLERTLVLPGGQVRGGSRVRDVILAPDTELPAASRVDRRLVSPAREGVPPAPQDSRVGNLLYTPILAENP